MTDGQIFDNLMIFNKYIGWDIVEPDGRLIKIHQVLGGKYGFFFILEWTDTNTFFCQEAFHTINAL